MKKKNDAASFEQFVLQKKWEACLEELENLRMELNILAERDFTQANSGGFSDETRDARTRFEDYCNNVLLPLVARIDELSSGSEGVLARSIIKDPIQSTSPKR